jgi:hypothetical protein
MARLESGLVSPDQFDFNYLRFRSGRYGLAALERLKTVKGPNAEAIKQDAEQALALTQPYALPTPPSSADLAGMAVFPAGQALPQSLARQNWTIFPERYLLPACLFDAKVKCEAFVTGGGGGGAQIVVAELTGNRRGVVFHQDGRGAWRPIGTLSGAMRCERVRDAFRAGSYSWVPSLQQDLEAAGERLTIVPLPGSISASCR